MAQYLILQDSGGTEGPIASGPIAASSVKEAIELFNPTESVKLTVYRVAGDPVTFQVARKTVLDYEVVKKGTS